MKHRYYFNKQFYNTWGEICRAYREAKGGFAAPCKAYRTTDSRGNPILAYK